MHRISASEPGNTNTCTDPSPLSLYRPVYTLEGEEGEVNGDLRQGTPADYWCNAGGLTDYYHFIASQEDVYSLYLSQASFDGVLFLRTDCNARIDSRCNDDGYIQHRPAVSILLEEGEEIYLKVGSYHSLNYGPYTLKYARCELELCD